MTRTCTGCLEVKSVEDFGWHNKKKMTRKARCRKCYASYVRDRRHTDPEFRSRQLRSRRLSRYGLTEETLNEMWERQERRCAICRVELVLRGAANYAVDHDHSCCPGRGSCGGCVRGLLCFPCNAGIGQLKDSVATLLAAAEYLSASSGVRG